MQKLGVGSVLYWIVAWVIESFSVLLKQMAFERDELEKVVFLHSVASRDDIQRLYNLRAGAC